METLLINQQSEFDDSAEDLEMDGQEDGQPTTNPSIHAVRGPPFFASQKTPFVRGWPIRCAR